MIVRTNPNRYYFLLPTYPVVASETRLSSKLTWNLSTIEGTSKLTWNLSTIEVTQPEVEQVHTQANLDPLGLVSVWTFYIQSILCPFTKPSFSDQTLVKHCIQGI